MPTEELRAYACEDTTLFLRCEENSVIRISRAVYGRFSFDFCNEQAKVSGWDVQCMALNSTKVVGERCDGHTECKVLASNKVFGDPCVNTPKYLQGVYCCEKQPEPETDAPTTSSTTTTTTATTTFTSTTKTATSIPTTGTPDPPTLEPTTKSPPVWTEAPDRFCPRVEQKGVWWPKLGLGKKCPVHVKTTSMIEETADVTESVKQLSEQTASQTLGAGDLKKTTKTIFPKLNRVLKSQLNASRPTRRKEIIKSFSKEMVTTGSNLLSNKQKESWKELPSAERSQIATSITVNMEETGFEIAANLAVNESVISEGENILLEVSVVGVEGESKAEVKLPSRPARGWDGQHEKVSIPIQSLHSQATKGQVKIVFLVYQNLEEWMDPESEDDIENTEDEETYAPIGYDVGDMPDTITMEPRKKREQYINTNIFSASINSRQEKVELIKPFTFTLKHKQTPEESEKPACAFWDIDKSGSSGTWSSRGCSVIETSDISTTCQCNHFTNFAVLMDVQGTKLTMEHEIALMTITYVGCVISIVCLFCSLFTFSFFKNLQCDRNTIHKNLVLCLMLAEIVFIVGITLTQNKIVCGVIAGLLHFLFLASFSWMCLEGVQLYVMLIEVFEAERSRRLWYYIVGYGAPLIIVGVSAGVKHEGYGTDKYCWLSTQDGFIWSFVGPVIVVLFINVIMLSIAVYMMCKHAHTLASSLRTKEKSRLQKVNGEPYSGSSSGSTSYIVDNKKRSLPEMPAWIKGAAVLVVLLGLTWSFGFMYVSESSIVMAYVFTILNTLQGLFIFVFHCLMNEKVKKEYKKLAYRSTWLPGCLRNICVGYSGSMSHSPHNSSSSGGHLLKFWSGRRRRSSSSTLEKGHKGKYRKSDPRSDSEFFTSTGKDTNSVFTRNGSARTSKQNGQLTDQVPHIYHEIDGMAGDLSVMDCSVIDTEYVSEYCQNQMQVSMEKRRYSSGSEDANDSADDAVENKNRLSVLSDDSAIKNISDFASSEADAGDLSYSEISDDDSGEVMKALSASETELLVPRSDSERNLLNNIQQVKLNIDDEGKKLYPGSINEIYMYKLSSGEDLNHSTPCLKFKSGNTEPPLANDANDSHDPLLSSLPQLRIIEDEDFDQSQNFSHSMDLRPVTSSIKKKKNRLSSDGQTKVNPHQYDLDYSEC
ncbi:hypothetical protein FSP39_014692 [Pinctada imbricata]|uniref:Latrophilin-3 n=1 Tax=Pinctada imbricata TaxID=66713 RepID=A0AA88XSC7_PINIB|nr:hypothetical protein FSP39_014692 [Pinctada imbricata]